MVHPVKTPEKRNFMEEAMLGIDGQIERRDRYEPRYPGGQSYIVKKPKARFSAEDGNPYGAYRKNYADKQAIEKGYRDVAEPTGAFGLGQNPPGDYFLPKGHKGKNAEERGEADKDLMIDDEHIHMRPLCLMTCLHSHAAYRACRRDSSLPRLGLNLRN